MEFRYNLDTPTRVDVLLTAQLKEESRVSIQRMVRAGEICVDGVEVKAPSRRLNGSGVITISPRSEPQTPVDAELQGSIPGSSGLDDQHCDLDIVFEDDDLVVINKAAGIVVHPGAGNRTGTLADAIYAHYQGQLSTSGGAERPGIVHRLDKDTSGLLVVARNDYVHRSLAAGFADRTSENAISRSYIALVRGIPAPRAGLIELPLGRHPFDRLRFAARAGGRQAKTHYQVQQSFGSGTGEISVLGCKLYTGRTHQIRVHLSEIGHPILGDALYGRGRLVLPESIRAIDAISNLNRQALHAAKLSFVHPRSGCRLQFEAPLPQDMAAIIAALATHSGQEDC